MERGVDALLYAVAPSLQWQFGAFNRVLDQTLRLLPCHNLSIAVGHSTEMSLAACRSPLLKPVSMITGLKCQCPYRPLLHAQVELLDSPAEAEAAEYTASLELPGGSPLTIGVARARGNKCSRCWNYSEQVGSRCFGAAEDCGEQSAVPFSRRGTVGATSAAACDLFPLLPLGCNDSAHTSCCSNSSSHTFGQDVQLQLDGDIWDAYPAA